MTSYRTTILLAIIFAGLGLYLYTIEVPSIEHEVVQQQENKRLLPFDYREVTDMTIKTRNETIRLARDERYRWRIVEPVNAKGDSREVNNILRAIEIGKISRVVQEESNDLSHYGLETPNMTIQLKTQSQSETLSLGEVGPLTSTLYAQRHSDKQVLLTTLSVTDFRRKSLFTFRHKDVMFFDRTLVERIQIQGPDQSITLHRGKSIHGPTSTWLFSEPFEGPADKTAVGLFLMTLENLTAKEFIDTQSEKQALFQHLPKPTLTATVHTSQKGYIVSFFQPNDKPNEAYAITSADQPIYKISPNTLQGLPKHTFALQDKRLFGLETHEIALLTITAPSGTYTVAQQHGNWYLDGAPDYPINQEEMKLLVSRVVDLPAELSIAQSDEHLDEYELTSPSITIVGVDIKGRQRGYLALGKRESGLVYAKGAGLPGVYQARSVILTQIPSPGEIRGIPH